MSFEIYSKQDGYEIWHSKITGGFYIQYDDRDEKEPESYECAALAIVEAERVMASKS